MTRALEMYGGRGLNEPSPTRPSHTRRDLSAAEAGSDAKPFVDLHLIAAGRAGCFRWPIPTTAIQLREHLVRSCRPCARRLLWEAMQYPH